MRLQGRITSWDDARGFGRVSWHGGGEPLFIHIKAFRKGARRPVVGEVVTYELGRDERGRPRADRAECPRKAAPIERPVVPGLGGFPLFVLAMFVATLAMFIVSGRLPLVIAGWYAITSIVSYAAYWLDKRAAENNRWRTPEATLHMLDLLGGWPGAVIAQRRLRHKSSKREFRRLFWATAIFNCLGLAAAGQLLLSSPPNLGQ